jgi:hypothetical protein
MADWRGIRRIEDGLAGLLRGRDDALLWLAIALLIIATLGHFGAKPREYDYLKLALEQTDSSPALSIQNGSGSDVVVMVGTGDYSTGYRLAAGSTEPFLTLAKPLRVMDPVTCATIATLDYSVSGFVVLREAGRTEFTPGGRSDSTATLGISSDITYACAGRVRAEAGLVPHPGMIVGIGDDRLWSSLPDGSIAPYLPSGRMPIGATPLHDGHWLVSTTTGWNGLNAGVFNRWIVDPATNTWTSFRDDAASVAFSPDGRWMAYIGAGSGRDLRVVSADAAVATATRADAAGPAAADRFLASDVESFSWSPDSSRILVTTVLTPDAVVMKVELIDLMGNRSALIDQVGRGMEPVWSPDGQRLVVGLARNTQDGWPVNELLILDTSGRRIGSVDESGQELGEPRFSPDGKHLAFEVIRYPYPTNAQVGQLMIAASDGSNPTPSIDWLLGAGAVVWSPDGTAFVAERMEDTGPDQMVMGFIDGRHWTPIAESLVPIAWLP